MRKIPWLAAFLLTTFLFTLPATAVPAWPQGVETKTFSPSKDNSLYESTEGNLSNGAGVYLFAGTTAAEDIRRALIAFDLQDAIPDGAVILSAQLKLHLSKTNSESQMLSAHRLLADWGEGDSDAPSEEGAGAPAAPGDATWIHTFCCNQFWADQPGGGPGGHYQNEISASAAVGGVGDYVLQGDGLVRDVETWRQHPEQNYGWILRVNEAGVGTAKRFDSRQNANTANRPQLIVRYFMPSDTLFLPVVFGP